MKPAARIRKPARVLYALAFAGMLGAVVPAQSGPLTIANEPLGAPAGLILPNIMFIMDASGSMASDYLPEYVNDSEPQNLSQTASCADTGDETGSPNVLGAIDGTSKACIFGDPPYNSNDFNQIYYNPEITYKPGVSTVDAVTGVVTYKPAMDKTNTTNWTQVPAFPYTSEKITDLVSGSAVFKMNLATGYPDRFWCQNKSDLPNSAGCRQNTAYQYPDTSDATSPTVVKGFNKGQDASSNPKYAGVSPYYYRMQTAQYCTNAARTTCVTGSAINLNPASGPTHTFLAPEFCSDKELTTCVAGDKVKFCTNPATTTPPAPPSGCVNASAITAAHIYPLYPYAGPRWCTNDTTMLDCRRKKLGAYKFPHHLGLTQSITCSAAAPCPAVNNQGNIVVNAVNPAGGVINGITINGVSVISAPITITPAEATPNLVATKIAAAINAFPSPVYNVPPPIGGNNVRIQQIVAGVSGTGAPIVFNTNTVGTQSSIGAITLKNGTSSTPAPPQQEITVIQVGVGGTNLLCPTANPSANDTSFGNGVYVKGNGDGRIVASLLTNSNVKRQSVSNAIISRLKACTAVNGYTTNAAANASTINVIAPVSLGDSPNGLPILISGVLGNSDITGSLMGSVQMGASSGDVSVSLINMSGGKDPISNGTTLTVRKGTGSFSRTDIVNTPGAQYPKASRTDCTGKLTPAAPVTFCTYEDEMTNFSNWFAYYRTRMQMMKTSVGLAFVPLDTNYRIGFITICPISGSNCTNTGNTKGVTLDLTKYQKIAEFTPAQKSAWYTKLYAQTPGGSTPLREALARVGMIYAGNFGGEFTKGLTAADEPMIKSCQPNFALLTTDGYWNGGPGYQKDGTTPIGNQDSVNAGPYSLQKDAVFDGSVTVKSVITAATLATDTLADVALYYYQTDLRPSGTFSQNNVAVTTKDIAPHQHMVTFTLGLGIDGELTYDRNYETQSDTNGGGDFFDIKQGTKKWSIPAPDSPSALDDLWHAAVNGRGVFYSIKNPTELANSLTDMRDQLQAKLGAGAAAATSNLQPVAGDNFAFTASFTTSAWTGDLKARTIDLASGVVSTHSLWSAAAFLDVTPYTNRQIYTFDATDSGASGNRLKNFCPPGASDATCADGTGLTPSPGGEMDYFATNQLPQVFDPAKGQAVTATSASLVNYLRGDRSFENSSASRLLATDLYRQRDSLLGDIVNAQPAYVKRTPFSYGDKDYDKFRACTEGNGTACPAPLFPNPLLPRRGTVYAASNDGMLHAFETDTTNNPYYQTAGINTLSEADDAFTGNNTGNGAERWAYIPGLVLPKIYKIASEPYAHTYSTDGTPLVGDICVSTPCAGIADWRTILVGGLNSGGIGYYALDITNPFAPKALWEFKHSTTCITTNAQGVPNGPVIAGPPAVGPPFAADCNLGLSYGNPVITKRFYDQRWVVIVTSGYNNNVGGGDGKGYLYVLDAVTGNILHRLSTGVGSAASPSGLSRINGWTTNGAVDNTALAIYGGDLEGNMWRFKLEFKPGDPILDQVPSVTKVAVVKDSTGATQPITVKPELGDVSGERVIVFGTGKFLEVSDKTPPQAGSPPVDQPFPKQTFYALRDSLNVTGAGPVIPNVRDATTVRVRTFAVSDVTSGARTVAVPGNDPALVANPALANDPNLTAPPNLAVDTGWLIDLPDNGERVNVDPVLQLGTIVFASNIPTTDTCSAGGYSYINFLGLQDGAFVPGSTNNLASVKISTSILVGVNVIMLPGGAVKTIGTLADETRRSEDTPIPPAAFVGKRVSWRELFIDQ